MRAFLYILDSFGIGGAPDAAAYGDLGSDTFGHVALECAAGRAEIKQQRSGVLKLPNMEKLGLALAAQSATGKLAQGFDPAPDLVGVWANATETSKGKDTPSGHFEICGVPVLKDWGYFPNQIPAFPASLTDAIIAENNLPGILGNCHASGTQIIAQLGEEHISTGKPICYTSVDSVFQIAAHEAHFGLERLYALCQSVFEKTKALNIGRVIARPFIGQNPSDFERSANRRDFAIPPPAPTLLEHLKQAGREVIAIGKIADIFAHKGPTQTIKAAGNANLAEASLKAMEQASEGSLIMTNFVDFDMLYGHRRDVTGYAAALEEFDAFIPKFMGKMKDDDLMVLTADHGNDPTWTGTDHTREQVPVLLWGPGIKPGSAGSRSSFADIAATLAEHFELSVQTRRALAGKSFYRQLFASATIKS